MKGDRVTVRFNGKRAFENFEIAGLDANGPIAFKLGAGSCQEYLYSRTEGR